MIVIVDLVLVLHFESKLAVLLSKWIGVYILTWQ